MFTIDGECYEIHPDIVAQINATPLDDIRAFMTQQGVPSATIDETVSRLAVKRF